GVTRKYKLDRSDFVSTRWVQDRDMHPLGPKKEKSDRQFPCDGCGRIYMYPTSLYSHRKYECGKEPQFPCPVESCTYKSKIKGNIKQHLYHKHKDYNITSIYKSMASELQNQMKIPLPFD
ncbi:hypothetical protein ILUMI_13430, partial [Ignelater luminosus]